MASSFVVAARTAALRLLLPVLVLLALPAPAPATAAAAAPAPAVSASSSGGLVFHVGGPRGWRVPDAHTNYGWWAMNNRFHVGDELCE